METPEDVTPERPERPEQGSSPTPGGNTPPDLQALIDQAVTRVRDEMRGELTAAQQQYQQRWDGLQRALNPQQQEPDADTQWLMNPSRAMQGLEERIVQRLTTAYEQRERAKDFWQNFYDRYEELRGMEWMVRTVLENDPRLRAMNDPQELTEELAKAARHQALLIARNFPGGTPGQGHIPHVESAGGGVRRGRQEREEPPPAPVSLARRLREMREAQRKRNAG